MLNLTCQWLDGCNSPVNSVGLCKRHVQRARRSGTLEDYRLRLLRDRVCEECGTSLPMSRRSSARFCSHHCINAAQWRENKALRLESHQAWRNATRDHRLAANRARFADKTCAECGELIKGSRRSTRKFCSRYCVNQAASRNDVDRRRAKSRDYQSRLREASDPGVSKNDWRKLVARHAGKCAYCRKSRKLTMDHVVPLSLGGRHAIGNILPACRPCNSSKGGRLLVAWRAGTGRDRIAA